MSVTIPLSPDTEHRIEAIAARTGITRDAQLRDIVEAGLSNLEDYYTAIDVRDRVRAGSESVTSLDIMERELGLAS